jgi:hypothetical protein
MFGEYKDIDLVYWMWYFKSTARRDWGESKWNFGIKIGTFVIQGTSQISSCNKPTPSNFFFYFFSWPRLYMFQAIFSPLSIDRLYNVAMVMVVL